MLFLRRHVLPLLRAATPLPSPISIYHRAYLLSTSTSASAAPFSLGDYLVAACGLAADQARKTAQKAFDGASKDNKKEVNELSNCRLNSASNPDAILALLSGVGLSSADIADIVVADPLLLRSSPKNVGPRLLALRDRLGLSAPQIVRFLLVGSHTLRCCNVIPKMEFFISFFGSFDRLLVIMNKKGSDFLRADLERVVKPNIALLRQCGLSVGDIGQLSSRKVRMLYLNPESLKELVRRTEELGVHRSSGVFKHAISAVASINKDKVAPKLEFLKSTLGCSESEAAIVVSKMPSVLGYTEENLIRKIQFLIKEVGMEPQYIVEHPAMLSYSMEKRLVPRHRVMKMLQAKGLLGSIRSFYSFVTIREEAFKLRFISCHEDSVPGLAGYYAAACAGDVSPEVQLSS